MSNKRLFKILVDADVTYELEVNYWPSDGEVDVAEAVTRWLDPETSEQCTLEDFLLEWGPKNGAPASIAVMRENLIDYLAEECWELCQR